MAHGRNKTIVNVASCFLVLSASSLVAIPSLHLQEQDNCKCCQLVKKVADYPHHGALCFWCEHEVVHMAKKKQQINGGKLQKAWASFNVSEKAEMAEMSKEAREQLLQSA